MKAGAGQGAWREGTGEGKVRGMEQRQANQADGRTFRERVRSEARFLWKLQWAGLIVFLGLFVLSGLFMLELFPWSLLPWLQIVGLAAIAGFSYASYRGCTRVKCPRCGQTLYTDRLNDNLLVCWHCSNHLPMSANRRSRSMRNLKALIMR